MAEILSSEGNLQSSFLGLPMASYLAVRSHNTTLGLRCLMCQEGIMTLLIITCLLELWLWLQEKSGKQFQGSEVPPRLWPLLLLLIFSYCHGITKGYPDSLLTHLLSPIVVISSPSFAPGVTPREWQTKRLATWDALLLGFWNSSILNFNPFS